MFITICNLLIYLFCKNLKVRSGSESVLLIQILTDLDPDPESFLWGAGGGGGDLFQLSFPIDIVFSLW